MKELLGKGGFACVYRARSRRTHQYVAIKMVGDFPSFCLTDVLGTAAARLFLYPLRNVLRRWINFRTTCLVLDLSLRLID